MAFWNTSLAGVPGRVLAISVQSTYTVASYCLRRVSESFPKWTKRVRHTTKPPLRAFTESMKMRSMGCSIGMLWRKRRMRSSAAPMTPIGSIRSFQSSAESRPMTAHSFSPCRVSIRICSAAREVFSPSQR